MILYPAIDLKDGKCVRLVRGDMNEATVFNNSPAEQARVFQDAGCEWLHVVDLNGAFEGKPVNISAVESILHACPDMKIQLGGGIRNLDTIEYWLDAGISRVILGTTALENPVVVHMATTRFSDKIAIGIDARDGLAATNGWVKNTSMEVSNLANEYEVSAVSAIIYTDIARDGAMQGPNIEATAELANSVNTPVIASGGVSSLADLKALKNCGVPLNGVIVGRALYDKKIDIKEALALLNE
ncbi:MAG: 1-(5-phosphoribosyl)-5-[(5-phosphoribosylamino)methylideneamino]imidazole-4-carboxamide isomerase [Candidatus Halichondribacter symbioticus]